MGIEGGRGAAPHPLARVVWMREACQTNVTLIKISQCRGRGWTSVMPKTSPRITLRLPEHDLERLRFAAETEGLSVSELVRKLVDANSDALHKKVRQKAVRSSLDAGVIRDLARAGNNLNRIAVALVKMGFMRRLPSMPLVAGELASIRNLLEDIRGRL